MRNPLIDVIGFALLIPSLELAQWLLAHEPHTKAIVTYSAFVGILWRGIVLARRWWRRREEEGRPKRKWRLK